jgi:hypothetical protein
MFYNSGLKPAVRDDRPLGAYAAIYNVGYLFTIG